MCKRRGGLFLGGYGTNLYSKYMVHARSQKYCYTNISNTLTRITALVLHNKLIYLSLWSSGESVPLEQLNEGNLSL